MITIWINFIQKMRVYSLSGCFYALVLKIVLVLITLIFVFVPLNGSARIAGYRN